MNHTASVRKPLAVVAGLVLGAMATTSMAADFITQRVMSMEMARDIAQATVDSCRAIGYQTSAVVVDRGGIHRRSCATRWPRRSRSRSRTTRRGR